MFKRVFTLLIALMILFGIPSALAAPEKYKMVEDFKEFDVEIEIPEGALYKQNPQDGWLCLEIWYEDAAKPYFDINISFSEEAEHAFLADFTQEELDHLVGMVNENFSEPVNESFVTPSGNTILLFRETDPEAGDYASMVTVYKSFFFSFYCSHKDYAPLTEDDMKLMHQIVEGTWIVDTEK